MIESFHAIVRYSAKGGTGKETVLAHGVYGGTALVPAAAAVPFMTLIPAAKPIHIVAIEDVVETVAWALRPDAPGRVTLDLVHPEPKTLAVIITGYRDWLGLRPHPVVTVPGLVTSVTARVADALSWLGWRSPIRTSAIRQLADGINGNPAGWIATTGITPKSLDDVLAISPATVQDRWFARLYLIKPLAIAVLAAFWIMTGLIALGPGWDGAKLILRIAGANAMTASIAVSIGAIIDIVLGVAIIIRRTCRAALIATLAISLGYVAAGTIATPHLFVDPLGSILKIFPLMLATLFILSILDER